MDNATSQHHLLYNVRLGIRYHMHRQAFFERWHRLTGIISLAGGSTAVVSVLANPMLAKAAGAAIALSQAVDLMVDTRKQAELHRDLRRRYTLLEPRLTDTHLEQSELATINENIKNIEIEEPPIKHWLMGLCQNETLTVMGRSQATDPESWTHIGWIRRLFVQWP